MSPAASIYRILKPEDGEAPSLRTIICVLVVLALVLTGVGVARVSHQHEVLSLGFELGRTADRISALSETRRELELERATLTAPDRIKKLASQLGMTTVAPERIRVVTIPTKAAIQ
jgi:cell division protein FtsL